jgi:hypothetical protein
MGVDGSMGGSETVPTREYFSFLAKNDFHFVTPCRRDGAGHGSESKRTERGLDLGNRGERPPTDLELGRSESSEIMCEMMRLEAARHKRAGSIDPSPDGGKGSISVEKSRSISGIAHIMLYDPPGP